MPAVSTPRESITSVRILGGVHAVAADGSLVDLPSASQRRLLAILALHAPRRLRSEWLADTLEISPGALRTSVSRVRATLGAAMLETASTGYALVGEVDATRFCDAVAAAAGAGDRVRALQLALGLWNGAPLDEFCGERWADGDSARLTEIHAGTVDDLAEALVDARQAADAVAQLESQIARYPYRDRSRGLLIRALSSSGRQADALRAFQQYRAVLIEEFGTDPSPDVVRIERRIATGWDGVAAAPVARAVTGAAATRPAFDIPLPSSLMHQEGFVGRHEAMKTLANELDRASESGLRCVLIGGEAGIGKTALLAAFAAELMSSATATVAYGRCDETGAALQPFRTVLAACVEHAPTDMLTEHVARHGGELGRICPSLALRVTTTPSATASDDATERYLAFEAASDLLRRIASPRPLVVMLDDLQWAEPTALLLLRHLAHALADAPVLLVLSRRDAGEAESEALRLALADVARTDARRLDLLGLEDHELGDLVSVSVRGAHGRAEAVVAALHTQTAGNPLYASQLIRHWSETSFDPTVVPPSLRDVVWSRINAIGDDATDVLMAASVLGVDFDEAVLLDMLDLPESTVIDTLDAAERNGLLIDAGSVRRSLRFVHALIASALYTELGSSRRARLHGLAAHALENGVDELPPSIVVQLARHCALAGRPAEALSWSTRAGDHALDHLAPTEAAQHYRVALDLAIALDRPDAVQADLLVRLGDAQHRCGDSEVHATLAEGARLAQRSGAHDALVRAVFAADRGFMRVDNSAPEYLATIEAAIAVTERTDVPTYARLRALLARSLVFTPDAARRLAAAHEALDLATEHGDPTLLAQVAPAVLYALWGPGRRALRSRVAAAATHAAESTGDPRLQFGAHLAAYNAAVESADHVVAARSQARMRAIAQAIGEPHLRWTIGLHDTFDTMMAGRLDEAEAIATATLDLGMQIGERDAFTFFAGELFVIGTFAGRHEELLPLVEQAARESPSVIPFTLGYAIVCAAIGRVEVAREILSEGLANRFSEISVDNMWMTSVIGYAVLAVELGDAETAAYLLPLIEPFSDEVAFNGVTSQGPVAAYVGKLASLLGEHDVAEERLRLALDIATSFGWMYHRATTLFALAQARYRRNGSLDSESEAWLTEASELCRARGFRNWIPQIDALAAAP